MWETSSWLWLLEGRCLPHSINETDANPLPASVPKCDACQVYFTALLLKKCYKCEVYTESMAVKTCVSRAEGFRTGVIHHVERARMSSVSLTIRTSNDFRPTSTRIPVCAKDGTRITRDLRFPSLTRRVANRGWQPIAYMSGVSLMMKGSTVKNGWHQSVSG